MDPEVARVFLYAQAAKEFGVLPSAARDDIEHDPEQLTVRCLVMLRYADAYWAERNAKSSKDLEGWKQSKMMDTVHLNKKIILDERRVRWTQSEAGRQQAQQIALRAQAAEAAQRAEAEAKALQEAPGGPESEV